MVETKLFIPRLRRNVLERPRLSVRLAGGSDARLTLISAPAGFGKTTLITAWLAARDAETRSVAWLSLDEGDREPGTFWTYLIAALQKVVPGIGAGVLPLLESAQPPIETAVAAVLNELSAVRNDVFLVLDDYHLVDGSEIRDGMVFLLEHLPTHIHLVISGRADPLLPLARLRARGELVEIRSADLRFTPDEVATYLNDVIGPGLTPNDVAALEGRTEGWIAALQLAVLSMQGRTDIAGFIAGFAGDDRHVVDYLVEEVLQRQTEQVRTFLLRTCLLERLTGPLCDAVTGERGGRATLEALDRANLFLAPLDDSRHWYRYHALFADMLQARLLDERPDEVTDLHRRASRWYEENGQPVPAVRHALAAGDVEQAANLIERAVPALQRDRQESVIRAWLDAIPDEVVRARPVLAVGMIGALMSRNEFDGVAERLDDVERRLQRFGSDAGEPGSTTHVMIGGDEAELGRLPAGIQLYRAALALIRGDLSAALEHARLSTDLAAADDHIVRAAAAGVSGLAFWAGGDLEEAHRAYSACAEGLQRAGHIPDVLGCAVALADIRITQGRLGDAQRTLEQALLLADRQGGAVMRGMPDMYVGLSQIACERGDLELATEHLSHGNELGEHMGLPQNPYRWRVAMARVRQAEGDLSGALALVDDAQDVYVSDFFPDVRPVAALRARLLAAHGDVAQALGWARERGVTTDDNPTYIREFEHITLAWILLNQFGSERDDALLDQVAVLLDRLQSAADAGGRTGSTIEILALQALRRQAAGDAAGALAQLERALTLAEPEGYVRVFVGAGPPMMSLLVAIIHRRPGWEYVRRILSADQGGATPNETPPGATGTRRQPGLVDRLSERELDVLRLLATDLDGPHIARRLIVSLNTVRTHTKSIYTKLGVNSRRAAVRRAAELGLLAGTNGH